MSLPLQRRLPGVRLDVPAPPLREALPRMDIALFVGFAACGPIDVPVAVESLAEFEAAFGGPVALPAAADGTPLTGLLRPALSQFFSNGGRRAWVVRVAGQGAISTLVPLQQTLLLRRDGATEQWHSEPAWLQARCPGSWADTLRLATEVLSQPLAVLPGPSVDAGLNVTTLGPLTTALAVGDSLRLTLAEGEWLQGQISAAEPAAPGADGRQRRVLTLAGLCSLRAVTTEPAVARVGWFEPTRRGDGIAQRQAPAGGSWQTDGRLVLNCRLPARVRLGVGEVLHIGFEAGAAGAWLVLDDVQATAIGDQDGQIEAQLSGRPWRVPGVPAQGPLQRWRAIGSEGTALWMQMALAVVQPGSAGARAEALALVPRSDGAASLFNLPDDVAFFTARGAAQPPQRVAQSFELTQRDAARRDASPMQRFPLASLPGSGQMLMLPLASAGGFVESLAARPLALPPLLRDGLDRWDWRLFAEAALAGFHADLLNDQAEAMRLTGKRPRPLRGMHAAFGSVVDGLAEQPTLLAVPDAVLPSWQRKRQTEPARRTHPAPPQPATEPSGAFVQCALTPLAAPEFLPDADPDATGNYSLRWSAPEAGAAYQLQQASDLAFTITSVPYSGSDTRLSVTGQPRGVQFYRVRATQGARTSPWSDTLEIRVGTSLYETLPWSAGNLFALHRLMLRTAAGRGDMLALLALPQHYRWPDAVAHAQSLRSSTAAPGKPGDPPPVGEDEARALSHGALFHPWLLTRRVDEVIASPPEGAIAGQLAAGATERGAWRAVAHRPLRDVVALALPASDADRQALLDAQVNPVRAAPNGFVLGSSETLIADADWRPVNVRRLMSLLRRAALRRGNTYVFEPQGDVLRRTVERSFEALLDELFQRGAFSGRSTGQAYRVELGEELNTRARQDAGQFWVELKVAPALPMSFLTVRLARSGERLLSQELR